MASNDFATRMLGSRVPLERREIGRLGTIVDDILNQLPPRQRTIVERYNFAGDAGPAIATQLGISLRQFWREHREASERIAGILETLATAVDVSAGVDCERNDLELQLRMSRLLENNGHWQEGAMLLETLANEVDANETRVRIELQLSQLYVEAKRLSLAQHHASIARNLAERLDPSERWYEFQVDTVVARILERSGDVDEASRILQRCTAQLRSWAHRSNWAELALIDALCERALLHWDHCDFDAASDAINDARSRAQRVTQIDPQLKFLTNYVYGTVHVQARSSTATLNDHLACYGEALTQGSLRNALLAASSAGECYIMQRRPEQAIAFLTPLVQTARSIGDSVHARYLFLTLAHAELQLGSFADALLHLATFDDAKCSDPAYSAMAQLYGARAHIGLGNYAAVLSSAESAETLLIRVGNTRLVGPALLYQAVAHTRLGRVEYARRILPVAIEYIRASGLPEVLADAYDLMGVVRGDPRYTTQARALRKR